jgi:uncharacterized protein
MIEILKNYSSEFIGILNEMSPYLLFGFLMAGLLHVLIPNDKVVRFFGGNNLRSVVNASILGVPLPLCSCGVIPTGLSFYKNGASKGSTVSFFISTPQTGIDSILVTYSMLGLPFTLIRIIVAFFTGIAGGQLTNRFTSNEKANIDTLTYSDDESKRTKNPIKDMFRYAFVDFLQDIAKWLVIGIVVAALISVLIPDGFFTSFLGNSFLSMLIVLAAATPLYVCATGSVPIAAVLMMKGLSPGAALVFLMAGPATNFATMTMIGKVMGRKTLIAYLVSICGGALLTGFIINQFLPADWFALTNHNHHNHQGMIPYIVQVISSIVLGLLLLNAFRIIYLKKNSKSNNIISNSNAMEIKVIKVKGMTCNHCKSNVEKGIKGISGIKEVDVNLQQGNVTISADKLDLDLIKSTVEGLGYSYAGEI